MTADDRDTQWFDEFWTRLGSDIDEDDGTSAIRLIAEMYCADLIDRDGDYLTGNDIDNDTDRVELNATDQYLIRRIFDAVTATNRPRPA